MPTCWTFCLDLASLDIEQRRSQRGATRAPAPPTAMIYMESGLSPGYRHEEEEEGKEGLEEEEEEASPGFIDSWLQTEPT